MALAELAATVLRTSAKAAAIGAASGTAQSVGVTWEHHRAKTHQSIETHPALRHAIEFIEGTLGVDSTVWASVHLIHHEMSDANMKPFLDTYRALSWVKNNPDASYGLTVPDQFPHLDPFVDAFSQEDVETIGAHAEASIKERLGNEYQEPPMSRAQVEDILNPQEPRYYYDMQKPRQDEKYTQDEIETLLLRDPHSPVLVPPRNGHQNGLRGVLRYNVPLFKGPGNLFKARPDLKPDHLQSREKSKAEQALMWTAGFVAAAGITYAARRDFTKEGLAIAAIAGSVANASRIPTYLEGGKITNANGHWYVPGARELWKALLSRDAKPYIQPDGKVTMDTVNAGVLGKLLSAVTLDEVGGQAAHHNYPENIAYTTKTGLEGVKDAPFGKLTEAIANGPIPLFRRGKQFGGIEKSKRPDMPNEGVILIEQRRAEQAYGHWDNPYLTSK